jgi:hypothetical protein
LIAGNQVNTTFRVHDFANIPDNKKLLWVYIMADIFISYKREDLEKVRPLAEILENKGWSVWWDPKLRGGKPFSQDIERALSEARCVIVIWSNKSIDSYWVAAEATKGLNRDILFAVSIESNVEPPVPFNVIHTNPLINWDGTSPSTQFDKIVEDLKSILGPPPVDVKEAERKAGEEHKQKQEKKRKLREEEQKKAEEEWQRLGKEGGRPGKEGGRPKKGDVRVILTFVKLWRLCASSICCISNLPGIYWQIKMLNSIFEPDPIYSVFHIFQNKNNPRFPFGLN